ncbi:trinucleotide repeat-containing gene 18 protein [Plakobranchus ocellatus]|uniref:Trinucleotide repeat-containing gene 18 protein n=1 Tax=Plakobranchus ocellatus TaxID=259542 RepID=A0AAV4ACF1_9GAST|nr:trinucleotide repeat-containing gene 18 protein [Plakobranchus ocellatus]
MSSFLTSAHTAEARKALLPPEFQHYWSEGVQRYLMSGLYTPYPPLFPPAAEPLTLLGSGSAGAGPAPAHHTAHYQRLLEMQKAEAYFASMSASHHPALYALPSSALPQFVEPPLPLPASSTVSMSASSSSSASPAHSSNNAPLSLVKQEPRDLSCAEKVAKQSERRAMGVKVDLDQHHTRLNNTQGSPSAGGGAGRREGDGGGSSSHVWSAPLKEPKLSPSATTGPHATSSKHEKRSVAGSVSNGGRATPGDSARNDSNADGASDKTSNGISSSQVTSKPESSALSSRDTSTDREDSQSGSSSRRSSTPVSSARASNTSNSNGTGEHQSKAASINNTNGSQTPRKAGKSSSHSSTKQQKSANTQNSPASPSSGSTINMPVPSVPTKLAPPIALATMQHDGILLSALASPSSAAASSAASKNFTVKQAASRGAAEESNSSASTNGGGVQRLSPLGVSNSQVEAPSGSSYTLAAPAHSSNNKDLTGASRSGSGSRNSSQDRAEVKASSDENSDIVVDSTESDDVMSTCDLPPTCQRSVTAAANITSEQERAIEETIERVLANEDGSDSTDNTDTVSTEPTSERSSEGRRRAVSLGITTSAGSSSSTRTVYAKTQCVPSMTAAGAVLLSSSVVSQSSTSALPYYHTLYSKPHGAKKVHATTFVPEVGVFRGPSIKILKQNASSSSSLVPSSAHSTPSSSSWHISSDFPLRSEPRPLSVAISPRLSDGTPSPSLLSPGREVGSLLVSPAHRMPSPGVSPSVSHISVETPLNIETGSSIDSASVRSHSVPSVRSQSVASVHSGIEVNDSDDASDIERHSLVIDDDTSTDEAKASCRRSTEKTVVGGGKKGFYMESSSSKEGASGSCREPHRNQGCFPHQHNPTVAVPDLLPLPDRNYPYPRSPKMRHKRLSFNNHPHGESSCDIVHVCGRKETEAASEIIEGTITRSSTTKISSQNSHLPRMKHAATCVDLRKTGADTRYRTAPSGKTDPTVGVSKRQEKEVSRCISAPPPDMVSPAHLCKRLPPAQAETRQEVKPEVSSDHTGGSIPVGIAVAQIRPHHVHQPRDPTSVSGTTRDHGLRHASPTGATRPKAQTTRGADASQRALAAQAGHRVHPSSWVHQGTNFASEQPGLSVRRGSSSPRYPVTAPAGFKFTVDPSTGQVFLVHSEDPEEQPGPWPVTSLSVSSGPTTVQPKTRTLALPTVTVHSPEPSQEPTASNISTDGKKVRAAGHQSATPGSNVTSPAPAAAVESTSLLWPALQSRGCSPILCEDLSSPLSLLSTLSSLSSKKPTTCSVGIQVDLVGRGRKKRGSPPKHLSLNQSVQTSPLSMPPTTTSLSVSHPSQVSLSSNPILKASSSHCQPLEVKVGDEGGSRETASCLYNPFTDPQILQAAHGLELLSTLAEKRPKCSSSSAASSLDDPKHIYPSPSDSFDTLSPTVDQALESGGSKSGLGHPRREVRRELSPKWTHPKKEPQDSTAGNGDFKPPPELELAHDLDVRVKLVEVQRQYKEKRRKLAKLQSKALDTNGTKSWKRGPGRPPKKKTLLKKSDDDSSSSSSKPKDSHQQQKKKRPAEELVDRIYRKLAPDKPNKVSRSIHYVKSKTGPFFRRKSASSSVKRNKDLFGIDQSTWPSYSERKHQEKVKHGKDKYKLSSSYSGSRKPDLTSHFTFKGKEHKSSHSKDTGNIFANLQKSCVGGEYAESGVQLSTSRLPKAEKSLTHGLMASSSTALKSESGAGTSGSHLSGLGLLAKFALTTAGATTVTSAPATTASSTTHSTLSTLPSSAGLPGSGGGSSATAVVPSTSTMSCFMSSPGMGGKYSNQASLYGKHAAPGQGIGTSTTSMTTFGSMSTLMSGPGVSFYNSSSSVSNGHSNNWDRSSSVSSGLLGSRTMATTTTTITTTASTPAIAVTTTFSSSSSNTYTSTTTTSTDPSLATTAAGTALFPTSRRSSSSHLTESSSHEQEETSSSTTANESSSSKRKDDDSDTDTSDTSPNKKRKPGRPRKINPDKSSGGTETIWAKKSCHMPENNGQADLRRAESDFNTPLFLDDEWSRRRSERIFLSEAGPSTGLGVTTSSLSLSFVPPSAVSPRVNSTEHVWKLSNFMPKSKKPQEAKPQNGNSGESPTNEVKAEHSEDSGSGSLFSGKQAKCSESPAKKGGPAPKENRSSSIGIPTRPYNLSTSMSSSSPSPQKSKRGRKPKDDKAKVKKVKKEESSSSSPSPPKLVKKEPRPEELGRLKQQKAKSLHNITQRVKKKFSNAKKQAEENSKGRPRKDKKRNKDKKRDYDPLDGEGPPTPEPRCCKLQTTDLREGLKVLYLNDGLFYEGTVKALQPPDVYGVLTAGQRGSRPHILCQEEVLKDAVLDVRPGSKRYLPVGTRVCAFWSQQFSCLYPGTVAKSPSSSSDSSSTVSVDFDDEDTGRIPIEHIRLLPADFPIIEYEPDPLENLPKKRKARTQSDLSDNEKPQRSQSSGTKKSTISDDERDDDDDESENEDEKDDKSGAEDSSDGTDSSVELIYWQWHGPPIRKPGQKGKIFAKGKRVYYKAITRASEVINVGDAAIFVSTGRPDFPYIGSIENLWQTASGNMMVKVRWYYHPEETNSGKKLGDLKHALFTSTHMDENDVQTIAHKCEVITPAQFRKRGQQLEPGMYYCAGHYDPVTNALTLSPGVM